MRNQTNGVTLRPVQFPSDVLPGVPPFEIGLPAGWEIDAHASPLVVMVDPTSSPAFLVNLMVGADRVAGGLTLEQVVGEMAPPAPASVERHLQIATIGGLPAAVRLQGMTIEERALDLAQLQVMLFAPNGTEQTKHLFYIHATCLAADYGKYAGLFTRVTRSFHVLSPE